MEKLNYRIESSDIMVGGPLLPRAGAKDMLVQDRGLAMVVAAKSIGEGESGVLSLADYWTGTNVVDEVEFAIYCVIDGLQSCHL